MHGWILPNGGVASAMLCNILVACVKCMLNFKHFLMNINVVAFFVWVFRALMTFIGNYGQYFFCLIPCLCYPWVCLTHFPPTSPRRFALATAPVLAPTQLIFDRIILNSDPLCVLELHKPSIRTRRESVGKSVLRPQERNSL